MIESDPNGVLRIVLPRHDDLPADRQPAFLFRAVKRRDTKRLGRLVTRMQQATDATAFSLIDDVEAVLSDLLVGWENQPMPFNRNDFDAVVDERDLMELAAGVQQGGFGVPEKKGSGSQPPSPAVTSAADAEPPVDASTDQTPNDQSISVA